MTEETERDPRGCVQYAVRTALPPPVDLCQRPGEYLWLGRELGGRRADLPGVLERLLPRESADAIALALLDIEESTEKICSRIPPALLKAPGVSEEELRERLWELGEEFRNIEYQMRDGELTEL